MTITNFPPLYAPASNNKTKYWAIKVHHHVDEDRVFVETTHGYINSMLTGNIKEIKSGKNIGKANETSKLEQAINEATSTWTKKKDKGYSETLSTSNPIQLPMLAHDYFKRGKDIVFPCYVQPKLNGVRMLAYKSNGEVTLYSRGGKKFTTLSHLADELINLLEEGEYLDGEIYNPDLDLQDIVSILKCEKEDRGRNKLKYWVYDLPNDQPFEARLASLKAKQCNFPHNNSIQLVDTNYCLSPDSVKVYFKAFVKLGNEGLMLRNAHGLYAYNHRSKDLQKYKEFQTDEFEIVDVVGGEEGKSEQDCAIFVCKTNAGVLFNARPKGSRELRTQWLLDRTNLIGKLLTVKYFEYTPDGVPFHPVGEAIRDYE